MVQRSRQGRGAPLRPRSDGARRPCLSRYPIARDLLPASVPLGIGGGCSARSARLARCSAPQDRRRGSGCGRRPHPIQRATCTGRDRLVRLTRVSLANLEDQSARILDRSQKEPVTHRAEYSGASREPILQSQLDIRIRSDARQRVHLLASRPHEQNRGACPQDSDMARVTEAIAVPFGSAPDASHPDHRNTDKLTANTSNRSRAPASANL